MGRRRRKRKPPVSGSIDYATGQIHIDFAKPPAPGTPVGARYEVEEGPPEPSVVDRIGSIESPDLAKRCEDYDKWVREGRGFKLLSFDFVSDPGVADAFPKFDG